MRRPTRTLTSVVAVLCSVLLVACGSEDGGDTATEPAPAPSTTATTVAATTTIPDDGPDEEALAAFCSVWEDTLPAMFVLGLADAFAEAGGSTNTTTVGTTTDTGMADDVLLLLLSPRLQALFEAAADASSADAADAFRQAAEAMAGGVERLADAGLSEDEIDQLREADLTAEEDLPTGSVDEAALQRAAEGFSDELDEVFGGLDDAAPSEAFEELVAACGEQVTGGVDPCDLLGGDTITSVVGSGPTVDGPQSGFAGGVSCVWEGDDGSELAVTVAAASYYDQVSDAYEASGVEQVSGLGDEAFVADGFNYAAGGGTSGRSLFVKTGERTVVVAVDPADGEPTNDQLSTLAEEVLGGLG